MMLRNLTLLQDIELSHDLMWVDEHQWTPVTAAKEYSLTGALLLEYATRQAGRPISLQPPDNSMAWHTREIADKLHTWYAIPGQQFRLTLDDGRAFTVVFRHDEPPALEAEPVRQMATYDPADYWLAKLKFTEV